MNVEARFQHFGHRDQFGREICLSVWPSDWISQGHRKGFAKAFESIITGNRFACTSGPNET